MARRNVKPKSSRSKGAKNKPPEERISHAYNHPVRLDAFTILAESVVSPKELARLLRQSLSTTSFHVRELLDSDQIELVRTEPRRGAVEHYYTAKVRPEITDAEWLDMPKATKRGIVATAVGILVSELLSALRHRKMEVDEHLSLIYLPCKLNSAGKAEVQSILAECQERIESVAASGQMLEGDDASVRFIALASFDRAGSGVPRAIMPKRG